MLTITEMDIRTAVDEIQASGMEEFLIQEPTAGPLSRRSRRSGRSKDAQVVLAAQDVLFAQDVQDVQDAQVVPAAQAAQDVQDV